MCKKHKSYYVSPSEPAAQDTSLQNNPITPLTSEKGSFRFTHQSTLGPRNTNFSFVSNWPRRTNESLSALFSAVTSTTLRQHNILMNLKVNGKCGTHFRTYCFQPNMVNSIVTTVEGSDNSGIRKQWSKRKTRNLNLTLVPFFPDSPGDPGVPEFPCGRQNDGVSLNEKTNLREIQVNFVAIWGKAFLFWRLSLPVKSTVAGN